jgi:excisionase family DNA binding protein
MSTTVPHGQLLTVAAVAERLSVSQKTVRRPIGAELLPGALRIGGSIRIDPDVLEEWLADSAVGGDSSADHASAAVGRSSSVGPSAAHVRDPESSAGSRARTQRAREER